MKKAKIFGRSIPVLAIVAIAASAGLVSAALLSYYGEITGTVGVKQSVLVDGGNYLKINTYGGSTIAGNTTKSSHTLLNRADVPVTVTLETRQSGDGSPDGNVKGITTSYWILDEPSESVVGEVNAITPSTNETNKGNGWSHVDASYDDVNPGEVKLTFDQPRDFCACFEYRTDGDTSQMINETNYNTDITDGLYPYVNLYPKLTTEHTTTMILSANEYVEVRMVFGGETDERFDWTKFDVLGTKIPEGNTITLQPGETIDFCIVNEFDVALVPGTYTITTTVVPS